MLLCNCVIYWRLYLRCSDYLFKLLLIGDSGVGKSCLLLRFAVKKGLDTVICMPHFENVVVSDDLEI